MKSCTRLATPAMKSPGWMRRSPRRSSDSESTCARTISALGPRMASRCKHNWSPTRSGKRAHDAGDLSPQLVGCAMPELIRIGTAGWGIPRQCAQHFPRDGSGLERYAARFTAVEINSTFRRSHRLHTFARWAETVPEGFRFAVKMPKRISHELRLRDTRDPLRKFWEEVRDLGPKLGPLLLQLPPSLVYDPDIAEPF